MRRYKTNNKERTAAELYSTLKRVVEKNPSYLSREERLSLLKIRLRRMGSKNKNAFGVVPASLIEGLAEEQLAVITEKLRFVEERSVL